MANGDLDGAAGQIKLSTKQFDHLTIALKVIPKAIRAPSSARSPSINQS